MKKFFKDYIEDILVFSGLTVIAGATFLLNFIAGLYAAGLILLLLGVYFTRHPLGR